MSEHEDTLRLASDKWIPTAVALQMIRVIMPPNVDPYRTANQFLRDGAIVGRKIPNGYEGYRRERAVRDGTLPPTEYEWNLQSLILRLLSLRTLALWPVSVETVLRLATIEPDQLPALELEKLTSERKALAVSKEPVQDSLDVSQAQAVANNTIKEESTDVNKTKATGRPIDPLWAQVLGHAAGWLAHYPGGTPTRGELQKIIDGRFAQLSSDPPDASTTKKYARQMLDAFKKFVETE